MSKWGVYGITGRLADGTHTSGSNRAAKKFVARWRVDGIEHERRFDQKGHANAFRDRLVVAKVEGWPADRYGWPVDPTLMAAEALLTPPMEAREPAGMRQGHTVESYVWDVWWPIVAGTFEDKNRISHRRNAELAVQLLRYGERLGLGDCSPRATAASARQFVANCPPDGTPTPGGWGASMRGIMTGRCPGSVTDSMTTSSA